MTAKNLFESVSRETLDRLRAYEALVAKWTPVINLVSKNTVGDIWQRHIMDSLQLSGLVQHDAQKIADFGSGAGFPGAILAIALPDRNITLVESDKRKATFLRTAMRELDLKANVLDERVEAIDPLGADLITARALAPLSDLLNMSSIHSATGTKCLFLKGRTFAAEISEAKTKWKFDVVAHPSLTDNESRILEIRDFQRGC